MELLFLGIATAFDFLILKVKFERERYADFTLDLLFLIGIIYVFHNTLSGMIIGVIAQVIVSLYLFVYPPIWKDDDEVNTQHT